MKKLFLVLIFSSILLNSISANSNSENIKEAENTLSSIAQIKELTLENQTKFQILMSKLSAAPDKIFQAAEKVNNSFNFVAKHIDTILTKQGAIKTLLILGPLFTMYCYFFPPDPIKALINKIVSSATQGASDIAISAMDGISNNEADIIFALNKVTHQLGKLQGTYNINYEIGQTSGLWQGMWNSPFSTFGLLISKGLEKATAAGIPFTLGLAAQRFILGIK